MSVASTFTISTADLQAANVQILMLRGRALPYRDSGGYTLEGSMRADVTWYPGNAVATIQMLGAEEKPTVVQGMWKDRFIKGFTDEGQPVIPDGQAFINGRPVLDVFDLVAQVEKIRLAGQLVRVMWDATVRIGILSRFRQTWRRREDVEWEMEFSWISRGEQQSSITLPSDASPDAFAKQLTLSLGNITTALTPPAFPVVAGFTAAATDAVSEISDAVAQVTSAVQNSVDQTISPISAAQRTLAAVQTIQAQTALIVRACDSTPPMQLINVVDRSVLGLADALPATVFLRAVREAARNMELSAADQASTLAQQSQQQVLLASFVARSPLDLRRVAQQYYGTQDEWRRLLTYNGFESSVVPVGTMILVPAISFADSRV